MRIDMHVHTRVSSPCSMIDPQDLIPWAKRAGLDGLCITEHEESLGAQVAWERGQREGFPIFRGMEIYTDAGDVLVFGLYEDPPHWITPIAELVQWVEAAGGVIIPAHPCRGSDDLHERYGEGPAETLMRASVAVETLNGGSSTENNELAERLRERYGLFAVGGSDSHYPMQLGRCFTEFDNAPSDEAELIRELREGQYRALAGSGAGYRL